MLSKLWTRTAAKTPPNPRPTRFRPQLEAMEERWVPADITDVFLTKPDGLATSLVQTLGPGAPLLTSNPYQMMMNTGRQIPGMLKSGVKEARDQLTWELNQLVRDAFPTPPMGAVHTLLAYVNHPYFPIGPVNITQTHTLSNFLFAGSSLTVTGTITGVGGPQPNLTTSAVGRFVVPSNMWVDDGNFVLDWTATQTSGQWSPVVEATAVWKGTKLLVTEDRLESRLTFLRMATGVITTDAEATYSAKDLGAKDATTDLHATAQSLNGTVTEAHGTARFYTPLQGGQMRLEVQGDKYTNGTFQLYSQYDLNLKNVFLQNDTLDVNVTGRLGTAVVPEATGVTLRVGYNGGVLSDDAGFQIQGVFEARRGINQTYTYGMQARLKDIVPGADIRLAVMSNQTPRPSVNINVYYAPTPLFELQLGYDSDPLGGNRSPRLGFQFAW